MKRRLRNPWIAIGWSALSLGVEASAVIGLRSLKIAAGGPEAAAETERMLTEKVRAAVALQSLALRGGLGVTPTSAASKTIAHYRRKVHANRRRLSQG